MEIHDELSTEESRHARSYLRRIVGIGLAAAVAIVLLVSVAWSTKAHAVNQIATDGKDWVRLTDKPCDRKVLLDALPKEVHKTLKNVEAQIGGEYYKACWLDIGDDFYYWLYEDGDKGKAPKQIFRVESI